ncbi:MAG: ATP phosphoribosyltransferase [Deltaproteobacteria bacterium]|nr:MAG: ATP phosphoribosyltransferase [Deltaproteobacteria bacterium]
MTADSLRFALPKGRMQDGVFDLLAAAGVRITIGARGYRPTLRGLDGVTAKLLKPQNIVEMLDIGSRDLGFAGADWVAEKGADLVELLDTELDPVRIVAAVPETAAWPPAKGVLVASEYERLTRSWMSREGIEGRFVRTYGATEVFPPEDADCIVDNTATGSTLAANRLRIVDEVLRSSTRLYASPEAMKDASKRAIVDDLVLLLGSVIEARGRVMLELNVGDAQLEAVVDSLPCLRRPTVSRLFGEQGYAVKAAVPRKDLPKLLPAIRAAGGTDVVVTPCAQIVR